jgi:tetratricopeptide (TPR) repeat protein
MISTRRLGLVAVALLLPSPAWAGSEAFQQGVEAFRKQDYDRAIERFSDALKDNPNDAAAYNNRGSAYYYKGDFDRAIADHNQALKLDPKNALAYYNRGSAHRKKDEFERAVADFQEAIRLDPKYAFAYNNLGWVLATAPVEKVRDGRKAVEYATKACDLTDWKDPNCLGTLAAAHAEAGNFDEAVKWQKEALKFPEVYGQDEMDRARARLRLFEERKPYQE